MYNNKFKSNSNDSLITISNRAKNFEEQFYMTGNIYEKDNTPANLNRKNLNIQDVSEYIIKDKLNCLIHIYENLGHAAYEEAKDFNKKVYEFLRG